ncbi:MAG: TrbC/VirB2 family protein [Acidobacteriota bacterium]|jgi:type IV secretory pathway VirB2 component (pilin)
MNLSRRTLAVITFLNLAAVAAQAQQDPLQTTAQKVIDEFNTLAPYIVSIGIILGGLAIMFGHSEGWSRLGKVIIGASILFGAAALINNLIR